ncbi:hypothetical protein AAFC00_004320 [Neodothiora populina]|uniref:3-methyl-2-oxobutanoate hydroxymethyltransferase n=1 Tax=Neodothiora populina TaxID=2781224 RepID=A0ABR3PJQ0_9PEZI
MAASATTIRGARAMSRALVAPSALSTTNTLLRCRQQTQFLSGRCAVSNRLQWTPTRNSSHSPLASNNGTPTRKKVTLPSLRTMYKKGEPITAITAHDFPSAHVADQAGIDMIVVGDSLAMVTMGMEDTSEITMEDMLLHCRSVARGTKSAFIISDLPMGSYEVSPSQAVSSALLMVKTGRVHGVKLEGGAEMAETISAITRVGIPVLAHIGLTPQRANSLGGFRVQGRSAESARRILDDALAVQAAGAFAVVLEAVPSEVAEIITQKLDIPTIGIGAGSATSGQILVQIDMSGYFPPGRFLPKFVKRFGDVWGEAQKAMAGYRDGVKSREFPAKEHVYPISAEELADFKKSV